MVSRAGEKKVLLPVISIQFVLFLLPSFLPQDSSPCRSEEERLLAVVRQLGEEDFTKRMEAFEKLYREEDPRIFPILTAALQDGDPEIQLRVKKLLEILRKKPARIRLTDRARGEAIPMRTLSFLLSCPSREERKLSGLPFPKGPQGCYRTRTDEEGIFSTGPIQEGEYIISLTVEGYPPTKRSFSIQPEKSLVEIVLDPAGWIQGTLLTPGGDLTGCALFFYRLVDSSGKRTLEGTFTTSEQGTFSIGPVEPGPYVLCLFNGHSGHWIEEIHCNEGWTAEITLTLPMAERAEILLLNRINQEPLPRAEIRLSPLTEPLSSFKDHLFPFPFFRDGLGGYVISGLNSGSYEVSVQSKGFQPLGKVRIDLPLKTEEPQIFFLSPLSYGYLSVKVVDPQGKPVPGAAVYILPHGKDAEPKKMHTNAAGTLQGGEWMKVPSGTLSVAVFKEGFTKKTMEEVPLAEEEEKHVEIALSRGAVLAGQVEGKEWLGRDYLLACACAPEDPYLDALSAPSAYRTMESVYFFSPIREDGSFRIENLEAGPYKIFALGKVFSSDIFFQEVLPEQGESRKILLSLRKKSNLQGRVLNPKGEGIEGAQLFALPPVFGYRNSNAYSTAFSDKDGLFVLRGVPELPLSVLILAKGFGTQVSDQRPSKEGGFEECFVTLQDTTCSIGGKISIQTKPFPEFSLLSAEGPGYASWPVSSPEEEYLLSSLIPGRYFVRVYSRIHKVLYEEEVQALQEGKEYTLNISLR